jgi:hypothetical protein
VVVDRPLLLRPCPFPSRLAYSRRVPHLWSEPTGWASNDGPAPPQAHRYANIVLLASRLESARVVTETPYGLTAAQSAAQPRRPRNRGSFAQASPRGGCDRIGRLLRTRSPRQEPVITEVGSIGIIGCARGSKPIRPPRPPPDRLIRPIGAACPEPGHPKQGFLAPTQTVSAPTVRVVGR